jgi:hypothetical protein
MLVLERKRCWYLMLLLHAGSPTNVLDNRFRYSWWRSKWVMRDHKSKYNSKYNS